MSCSGDKAIRNAAILNLFELKVAPLDPPSPKTPPYNQTWSGSDDRLRRYGHLKFFQDGVGHQLKFVRTENGAIWSAFTENPTLEQNITPILRQLHWLKALERIAFKQAVQVYRCTWVCTSIPYWRTLLGGRCRGSSATPFQFLLNIDYQPHPTSDHWWPSFHACRSSCIEQSYRSCHLHTFRSSLPVVS